MIKKQKEIVDAICREVGIEQRAHPGRPALNKKEGLQVLGFIRMCKQLIASYRKGGV